MDTTGPVLPIKITWVSLSRCSIVRPGLVIGFSQVYTPWQSLITLFSSATSMALSKVKIGPRSGSTS